MRKTIWLAAALALAALAVALAGCGGEEEEAAGGEVAVQLGEQNASGQSGTATLTAEGDATNVVVELGNPPAEPQPAHIHPGSCEDLDPQPEYPLTNVEGGTSETTVMASLEELTGGDFAINVHKSEAEIETYVACGDISGEAGGGGEEEGGGAY